MFHQIPFIEETTVAIFLSTMMSFNLSMTDLVLLKVTCEGELFFTNSTNIIQGFMKVCMPFKSAWRTEFLCAILTQYRRVSVFVVVIQKS